MVYTEFKGEKLSMLGMGCMRFPCLANGEVDVQRTAKMIDLCIEKGVNYFDSAWFYHQGKSEEIMGGILKKYSRESFNFATKMPWDGYTTREEMQAIFEKQLERTGFDYFDFYLLHNVSEQNIETYTDEKIAVVEYLAEQKKAGRIRHLGFSTHGQLPLMESFISKYREELEFCQIQLNWLDWTLQQAKEKVELLNKYELPIWVMEPLRGGRLALLSDEDSSTLNALRPQESTAAWSFRFLQGIDNIKMILSGMSDEQQIEDNIKTFSSVKPLDPNEKKTLLEIAEKILSKKTLSCTRCKYCVSECPMELDIPKLLALYSNMCLISDNPSIEAVEKEVEEGKLPSACIGCRQCESKCPQNIEISEMMADFAEKLK